MLILSLSPYFKFVKQIVQVIICAKVFSIEYNKSKINHDSQLDLKENMDQCQYLSNCIPTPPLTQQ